MTLPNDPEGICGAKRRQGDPEVGGGVCRLPAGWGTEHVGIGRCKLHGGTTPAQVKHVNGQKAAAAVVTFGLPVDVDPQTALLEEVHRTAGHVAWLGQKVAELDEADLKQLDMSERFEKPAVWVEMYERERAHLVKVAATCISAGIAERQVRLAEDQGRQLADVLRNVIGDVFRLLGEAGIEVDVLVRVQREQVPVVVRHRLSEVLEARG